MYTIYAIIYIPDNKIIYVGCTNRDINVRLSEHFTEAYKFTKRRKSMLYVFMRNHHINDFTCTILEQFEGDTHYASEREMYWINYYNTMHNGYNFREGGIDSHYIPDEREKEIVRKYVEDNMLVKEIAREFTMERHSVSRVLKRNNIDTKVNKTKVRKARLKDPPFYIDMDYLKS